MEIKPIKTVAVGVILSILIEMISGLPLMFMFADLTSLDFEAVLASNNIYLLASILASFLSLILASFIATKYAQNSEVKFGIIIGLLITALSLPMWIVADTFSTYPNWYSVLSLAMPVPARYLGAIIRRKKLNKTSNPTP